MESKNSNSRDAILKKIALKKKTVEVDSAIIEVRELTAGERSEMLSVSKKADEQRALCTVAVLGCPQLQTGDLESDVDFVMNNLPARVSDKISAEIIELSGIGDEKND